MVKASDLRTQSQEELQAHYIDACREIFALTNALRVTRKLERPHRLRARKKDRARILTLLRQKAGQSVK